MDRSERQKLGIKRWIAAGCQGTLCYATGVGKTRTAVTAIEKVIAKKPDADILIIVPTQVLKDQWLEDYIIPRNLLHNCRVVIINTAVKDFTRCDMLIVDKRFVDVKCV